MSEELDRLLILMVESNPHLYDKKLPGFKDKVLCNNSWKSIGDRLNVSSEDAMRRWKVLRKRFSKVRRQKANIPSGSGASSENQETEWSLYNTLLFLQPHVQNRKSIGNLALNASQKNKFSDDILYVDENSPETQMYWTNQ
ncbi:PREDICTED: transcription factor Adf-1-like [Trachymyrmex cornetzi]|uniref:transcription factor Adf-1-like n=1 Tax=Trachymyrmex cornetzi TaxID=471704 RepID=UPI00084F8481|nr:PREDICTED: transcription factor Adf-1-like [Trachymyrmex cornetzi]